MNSVLTSSTKFETTKAQTDKDFLKNVLSYPRIRFYEQFNGTSSFVDYNLLKEKTQMGCLDLELVDPWLPLHLKDISVDTFGTCVRLFEAPSCIGWSLAVYPGSSGTKKDFVPSKQIVVNSLGPCLLAEFQRAKVIKNYDGTRWILKDTTPTVFIPDELRFSGYEKIVSFSSVLRRAEGGLKSNISSKPVLSSKTAIIRKVLQPG
ncbi:unnamed protein product [Allacma fusca]|uniref:Uncharacterized protein n=1 Tax=Allacma fusca TaxID=39272 RepID=A0A8J2NZX4_9HEXA|nr:unnamed protein product [Allacma fusca]